MGLIIIV